MSVLGTIAIVAATTGSGLYTEAGYDLLFSDRFSVAARGQRVIGEIGYFHGNFMGSYRFGSYFRYGLAMSWEPIYVSGLPGTVEEGADRTFVIQFFHPHVTLARGVDLFRLGVSGKLRLGPVWSVVPDNDVYDWDAVWGGQLTAELSGSYNVATVLKIAPRVGLGFLIDEVRTSYQVTLGIGIQLQASVQRIDGGRPADYWEKDY